jgi:1-deoxy-D-xylulose-5-phosphate synthase
MAVGKMLGAARQAADELAAEGIDAAVWDVRVAKPLDEQMLADAATHPVVVTLEDGYADGGIGAAIAGRLEAAPTPPRLAVLGVPVQFIPHGKPDAILASLGLDGRGVAATVRDLVSRPQAGTPPTA